MTDLQKVAKIILESTGLDPESYRLGNSKAGILHCFKAFVIEAHFVPQQQKSYPS